MEKTGDEAGSAEVLSTRAPCYNKEVGEYKKAVSDCTKVCVLFVDLSVLTINCK